MKIEDYVECTDIDIMEHLNNYQTNHFSKFEWDSLTTITDTDKLNFAKKALSHYDLVGVYHQFDDFINVLCYQAGWPPIKNIPHDKVTSRRPKLSEIDPKIIHRLEELNQLDLALYDYATQLFNKKKRQVLHECIERRHREIYSSPSPPPSQDTPSPLIPLSEEGKKL